MLDKSSSCTAFCADAGGLLRRWHRNKSLDAAAAQNSKAVQAAGVSAAVAMIEQRLAAGAGGHQKRWQRGEDPWPAAGGVYLVQ